MAAPAPGWVCGGCTGQGMLCNRSTGMLLSPTTTLTSLLAGSSTTSNLCKHPQARAGSEPATKGLQTNRASPSRASTAPQGSTAASPHLQPSWKRIKLIYFTDCLQLKTPNYRIFCNTLQTIILFISIRTVSCQMLWDKRSCPSTGTHRLISLSPPYFCAR